HTIYFFYNDSPTTAIYTLSLHDVFRSYSADANARNYRISEDLLWLERRCARCAGQIQSSIHRKGHHPESGVPLGNGNKKRTTTFALCRNQRAHARRRQR